MNKTLVIMDKNIVINCMKELGFRPKELPEYGLLILYEGINMVYQPENDDDSFYKIVAPYIYEIKDENQQPFILHVINDVNLRIKYSKTMISGDNVYVTYEHHVFSDDEAESIVRFSIQLLQATVNLFNRVLKGGVTYTHRDSDIEDIDNQEIENSEQ